MPLLPEVELEDLDELVERDSPLLFDERPDSFDTLPDVLERPELVVRLDALVRPDVLERVDVFLLTPDSREVLFLLSLATLFHLFRGSLKQDEIYSNIKNDGHQ